MRKIVHIDMDCFYAAIEVRDDPSLRGKPVAVGGRRRGVLATASYEARKFGCRSAMPTFQALEICPELIILPPRFSVYIEESRKVRAVFKRFTELVEPLSLDEAYLDLSHRRESGAEIASVIRSQIAAETGLMASAGIAPNKLLAKIASDWNKPNGQFEIKPGEIEEFLEHLPVKRLHGVGSRMDEKLAGIEVRTCGDLQRLSKLELAQRFGSWGMELHELCRGRDDRPVRPDRIRKSVSKETTLGENLTEFHPLLEVMEGLRLRVEGSVSNNHAERTIKSLVVKMKFEDFTLTSTERAVPRVMQGKSTKEVMNSDTFEELLAEAFARGGGKAVRLVGVGVRFADPDEGSQMQLDL
ncbi:MAG: DNA polymerase IV [Verrucomicrobiaceae bacterium]|nr:DNA polymerase IV [Verrucomicrobiaceae bacterium]